MAETLQVNDPVADPQGVGLVVYEFLRTMQAALKPEYAGRFLEGGRMLAPLQVDYTDTVNVDRRPCPMEAMQRTSPLHTPWCRPVAWNPVDEHWRALDRVFDVPSVLHQMAEARDGSGDIGLVLVNWTDFAASWQGTFDPAVYGLSGEYSVHLLTLEGPTGGALDFSKAENSGHVATVGL